MKFGKSLTVVLFVFIFTANLRSQFPSIELFGGTSIGFYFNDTKDLNAELVKAGFPELDKQFLTLGGGGYIDLEIKGDFLRIGGLGLGFSSVKEKKVNDSLTKAVNYDFGMGGISIEYVKVIKTLDLTFGVQITMGTLKIDLYQYGRDAENYNGILGNYSLNGSSQNITKNFKMRFFGFQPQVGVGFLMNKFLYAKLNTGYNATLNGSWKVDNDIEVTNFPEGIKPGGFNVNLSINVGLFFR